jgi:hypothetical protein
VQVHPALREAIRIAASGGLRVQVLALLAGFPNRSVLSTQLHRTFAASPINVKRWTEVAARVEYTGDVLVEESDSTSGATAPSIEVRA